MASEPEELQTFSQITNFTHLPTPTKLPRPEKKKPGGRHGKKRKEKRSDPRMEVPQDWD